MKRDSLNRFNETPAQPRLHGIELCMLARGQARFASGRLTTG